jgi:hypothetical protein
VRVRPLSGCQVLESTPSADKKLDKLRSFVTCVCSNESCSMGRQMHLACFEDMTRRLMLNVTLNKETTLHSWLRQETNTKDGTRLLEFRANVSASDPLRLANMIWQHSREIAILSICKCRCGIGHLRYEPDACASCAGAEPDVDETELKRREKQFAIEERSRQAKEEEAKRRNEEREKRRAASLLASLRHTEQALRAREEKAARERGQDVLASAFEPGKPWASMRAARPAASAPPGAPGAPKSLSSLSPVGSSTSPHTSERKGKCSGWSSSWSLDAPDEEARAFLWTPPASPTLFPSELAAMSSACASPTKVYHTPTQRVEDPRLAKLRADGDAAREARAKAERLKKEAEAAAAAEWTAKAAGGLPGNSGSSSTADAHFVKLRGLPYQINEQQISAFFQPLFVVAVQIAFSPSRQPSGFGYVQFRTPEDTTQALHRTNQVLGSRYVEIFRCTRAEMEQARMHALTVMPSPRGHGGAPPAGQRGGGGGRAHPSESAYAAYQAALQTLAMRQHHSGYTQQGGYASGGGYHGAEYAVANGALSAANGNGSYAAGYGSGADVYSGTAGGYGQSTGGYAQGSGGYGQVAGGYGPTAGSGGAGYGTHAPAPAGYASAAGNSSQYYPPQAAAATGGAQGYTAADYANYSNYYYSSGTYQ